MREKSEIGLNSLAVFFESRSPAQHPPFRIGAQNTMVRKVHEAEEIHSGSESGDGYFAWMQFEPEFAPEESYDIS